MAILDQEVRQFIDSYARLFASPDACSEDRVAALCKEIAPHYRPGLTMFTGGKISRFQTQAEAAQLIETEMRNNISTGQGTKLVLEEIEKIDAYSETSAMCWLRWSFVPQAGSQFEGRGWTFTNIYGYRGASEGLDAGWEFVVRDHEVSEVIRVTGKSFE